MGCQFSRPTEQAGHREGHDGLSACEGDPMRNGLRRSGAREAGAQVPRGASPFQRPPISEAALLSLGNVRGRLLGAGKP